MIEVSAHDLCRTRLCATPGCEWDAEAGSPLCYSCDRGKGNARIRAIVGSENVSRARADRGPRSLRLPPDKLTPGEVFVLQAAADGKNTRETAEELGRAVETVKTHRHRAFAKLEASGIIHAVAIAWRRGLIT